jgi:hypothetical protein
VVTLNRKTGPLRPPPPAGCRWVFLVSFYFFGLVWTHVYSPLDPAAAAKKGGTQSHPRYVIRIARCSSRAPGSLAREAALPPQRGGMLQPKRCCEVGPKPISMQAWR